MYILQLKSIVLILLFTVLTGRFRPMALLNFTCMQKGETIQDLSLLNSEMSTSELNSIMYASN